MLQLSGLFIKHKIIFYKEMLKINPANVFRDINTVIVFGFNSSRFDSNQNQPYFQHKDRIAWFVNNNSLINYNS